MLAVLITDWSPERIAAILGVVITVVTTLATHFQAADKVKAGIAAVLAFIAGPVSTLLQSNAAIVSWASARYAVVAWGASVLVYFGAWKPFGLKAKVEKTGLSLGKPAFPPPPPPV